MGQIATAIGYVVGAYFGYPQLGTLIGAAVGAATTKGPNVVGPRLNDLRINGTEYGQALPWIAGAPRVSGQFIWASPIREIKNVERTGKGGGGKITTFTYEIDLLILLSENITAGVSRVWLNGGLVFNGTTLKNGTWDEFSVYTGGIDQLPNPTYEAAVGVGNAPAYRGRTTVMIRALQLGNNGQVPNLTFELRASSEVMDARIVLLTNFAQGDSTDLSTKQIGPGTRVGGILNDGSYEADLNEGQNSITWSNINLNVPEDSPFTVEYIFNYPLDNPNIVSSTQLAQFSMGYSHSSYIHTFTGILPPIVPNSAWAQGAPDGGANPLTLKMGEDARSSDDIHVAIVFHGDGFASVFYNGLRVVNRVAVTNYGSYSGPGSITLGTESTAFRDKRYTFKGVRVSKANVYDAPAIEPPATFTGDLGNSDVTFGDGQEQLHVVISKLMRRAGYADDEFDVSEIADIEKPVRGMAVGQITTTRAVLETLQSAFFFDSYTTDKIYFVKRDVDPVADIPFLDLGAASTNPSGDEPLELISGNDLELPAQITLSYANVLADYNVATEHSDRLISGQESNESVQLGLGMTPSEAKATADANLFDRLASQTRTTIKLPLKYAFLRPGNAFLVTDREGRKYRVRTLVKRDTLTILEHECVADDVRALISAGITSEDYTLTEDIIQVAETAWATMDLPPLRDADASLPGPYVAITPMRTEDETTWPGAVYVRSWGADDYQQIFISGDASTMGTADEELVDFVGSSYVFDETQVLRVRVWGEMASTTREDMLDDLTINAMAIGADGRWEIVRFRTAELIDTVAGQNVYDLSGFVRGQKGTEHNMGNHEVGDAVVLLGNSLRRMINQNSDIDAPSEVKAVTFNSLLSEVAAEDFTDRGVVLKPFSVANLRALAEGGDIVLDWQRRSRLSYRYGGTVGVSVPVGELVEAYRISVYDGITLVNTYPSTTPTWTYDAADIASDGFSPGDVITFTVAQLSDVVGEGYLSTVQGIAP